MEENEVEHVRESQGQKDAEGNRPFGCLKKVK